MSARSLSSDVADLRRFSRELRREAEFRTLRADFVAELKNVARPAAEEAKRRVRAMPSQSTGRRRGGSLRSKVASKVVVRVSTSGKRAGVRVIVMKNGMPRGFRNAPQRLNRRQGWRHPVFSPEVWVIQIGAPGWFDGTMVATRQEGRRAALRAMASMRDRIARRSA